ncbi:uncharacterized protein LOC116133465 [Pistacia vera]|uniref:uncharacterized protein LOC116133465 n=1 Tax=Pistacia vera TaxID=55513 RepID=UPI001262E7F4|nr:uncharacterized protein LOC116133465 [Pistacia vera]
MTIVPSNSTQRLLSFHNLETLTVMHCWNMKSLFPVSTATGLLQLKQLKMISCGLEEIVAKEEVDETPRFLFPQLTFLMLANLPELKCFYLGLHTTEWPMLEFLGVFHCEKIKIFASEFPRDQNTDQDSQPSFDLSGKAMPSLESLYLDVSHVRLMCHNHIPFEGFCQLKELFLAKLDDESIQFFYGFLKRLFKLETLALMHSSFNELFPNEIDATKEDSQVDPFLPNLSYLKLLSCNYLTHLWASSTSFTNLTTLEVEDCYGLVNIFTCSTVKSLVQLTKMTIRECKLLREIIASEFDQAEEEIVFCRLKTLELHCLASLTRFCSANYAFKFPCFDQVIVSECPKLKIFTQGSLSTPKLNRVRPTQEMNGEYVWKEDLNSTIEQMFIDMVFTTNLFIFATTFAINISLHVFTTIKLDMIV